MSHFPTQPRPQDLRGVNDPRSTARPGQAPPKPVLNDRRSTR